MAFIDTVRPVIDIARQRVSAHDRLYLAEVVPTLIVWDDNDRVIRVAHAYRAAEAIPRARLESALTFTGANPGWPARVRYAGREMRRR
jgi:pimeloyl-ACP methyl ester carboxylesterase